MSRFLRWLLTGDGHKHEWLLHDKAHIFTRDENGEKLHKHSLILHMCEICGKVREQRVYKND